MSIFDPPSPENEKSLEDLDRWCEGNWNKIPDDTRRQCVSVLRKKAPDDMLDTWKSQYQRGIRIGSDDPFFHLGIGMQVRNALRSVLKDNELPPVLYEGQQCQNWDDFYIGALHQLAREALNEVEDVIFSPVRDKINEVD